MASRTKELVEDPKPPQTLQIYPGPGSGVSPFWKEKYERDAKKYWDIFYKRHQDRFFKDRHYLDKEWDRYLSGGEKKVILEVGCGAGNTIFPLIATYSDVFIYACDFSPRAINLVKTHKDFTEARVNAFVCDLTNDDLGKHISPSSVDIVTMIFVLSAVSPEKMTLVLQNIKKILKPNSYVLFRDYALGDLAQERLIDKDQKISDNFYVRGDGTRAYYFSNDFLETLFKENGFDIEELDVCCKQVENRSRELVMNRRWVQAVFRHFDGMNSASGASGSVSSDHPKAEKDNLESKEKSPLDVADSSDVDMSEGLAIEMFGASPSNHQVIRVKLRDSEFKIKALSKEYQYTCKSTGLMLWESARLMASILERNPTIIGGKRVLELGCGCAGIRSMVAIRSAELVVATDGDQKTLELLTHNITTNLGPPSSSRLKAKLLEWGNKDQIQSILAETEGGFELIIGTDIAYVPEAVLPLFETARELLLPKHTPGEVQEPALILCHMVRRVDEPSLVSAAFQHGFKLVDRWPKKASGGYPFDIVGQWFQKDSLTDYIPNSALNILYFHIDESIPSLRNVKSG